uniref:Uncharacterized protein n=1 Tax=Ditylum brightwellii TaxID=49249 RepID=A0A7S4VJ69_9STRA|mmetsp:Transcript_33682/g.44949  ORF Transcript_33682/g.44949 Transcript_33682/m.44949 type:complete len:474 (+) Transcript_33682:132-1553(+)
MTAPNARPRPPPPVLPTRNGTSNHPKRNKFITKSVITICCLAASYYLFAMEESGMDRSLHASEGHSGIEEWRQGSSHFGSGSSSMEGLNNVGGGLQRLDRSNYTAQFTRPTTSFSSMTGHGFQNTVGGMQPKSYGQTLKGGVVPPEAMPGYTQKHSRDNNDSGDASEKKSQKQPAYFVGMPKNLHSNDAAADADADGDVPIDVQPRSMEHFMMQHMGYNNEDSPNGIHGLGNQIGGGYVPGGAIAAGIPLAPVRPPVFTEPALEENVGGGLEEEGGEDVVVEMEEGVTGEEVTMSEEEEEIEEEEEDETDEEEVIDTEEETTSTDEEEETEEEEVEEVISTDEETDEDAETEEAPKTEMVITGVNEKGELIATEVNLKEEKGEDDEESEADVEEDEEETNDEEEEDVPTKKVKVIKKTTKENDEEDETEKKVSKKPTKKTTTTKKKYDTKKKTSTTTSVKKEKTTPTTTTDTE